MERPGETATSPCFPAARKKRSNFNRRPHPDLKAVTNFLNVFSVPSSPAEYEVHEAISLCCSNGNSGTENDFETQQPPPGDYNRSDINKLKKVKVKLGGITRTLLTKPTTEIALGGEPLGIGSFDSHDDSSAHLKQDYPGNGVPEAKENFSRRYTYQNRDKMHKSGHKSKRAAKKVNVDEGFDDEDDEEIRYLKKLRASKAASGYGDRQEEIGRKSKGIVKLMGLAHSDTKDGRKKLKMRKDDDFEAELTSDDELKSNKKRLKGESIEPSGQELTITTRKRALECPDSGGLVEYPNGLPSGPSKKQKLSEVDKQPRKAEIAQRRRYLADKAAKEAEDEAIRKILGQDSNRKKGEKLKKQQKELAQERLGKTTALGPSTVRWIMGPNGTVVTFSVDMGLPKILDPLPCRYPPPREKCVGPNCTNVYKYRDSKSKLPLCSLHCYKALQGNMELLPTC